MAKKYDHPMPVGNDKRVKCLVCDKICDGATGYITHYNRVHGPDNIKDNPPQPNVWEYVADRRDRGEGDSIQCSACDYVSGTLSGFYRHRDKVHDGKADWWRTDKPPAGPRPYRRRKKPNGLAGGLSGKVIDFHCILRVNLEEGTNEIILQQPE